MKIKKFTVNPFQINCYLYYDEITKDGIIIDPGAYTDYEKDSILSFITSNKININFIINTHGHIDHICGNDFAKKAFNCPLLIHKDDIFLLEHSEEQGDMFGYRFPSSPAPDKFIDEDLIIHAGSNEIRFCHTPGHSPGSVCILNHAEKIIFSGDLLFKNSIGRTDLPGGDFSTLLDSIMNKLFVLCSDDYIIYSGHSEETTIGEEKRNNPFL